MENYYLCYRVEYNLKELKQKKTFNTTQNFLNCYYIKYNNFIIIKKDHYFCIFKIKYIEIFNSFDEINSKMIGFFDNCDISEINKDLLEKINKFEIKECKTIIF